jgi:methionine-rich copper-binding protein CopC
VANFQRVTCSFDVAVALAEVKLMSFQLQSESSITEQPQPLLLSFDETIEDQYRKEP